MQYSHVQAERGITAMQTAFEDACVTGYANLVESITNDTKDCHSLAAAVRTAARAVLAVNARRFRRPPRSRTTSTCSRPANPRHTSSTSTGNCRKTSGVAERRRAGRRTTPSFTHGRKQPSRCQDCAPATWRIMAPLKAVKTAFGASTTIRKAWMPSNGRFNGACFPGSVLCSSLSRTREVKPTGTASLAGADSEACDEYHPG